MRRAKEDIVRDIAAFVGPVLERKGFTRKKHRFDAVDGFGNKRPRPLREPLRQAAPDMKRPAGIAARRSIAVLACRALTARRC